MFLFLPRIAKREKYILIFRLHLVPFLVDFSSAFGDEQKEKLEAYTGGNVDWQAILQTPTPVQNEKPDPLQPNAEASNYPGSRPTHISKCTTVSQNRTFSITRDKTTR